VFIPPDECVERHIRDTLTRLQHADSNELLAMATDGWRAVADTGMLARDFDDELLLGVHGCGYDFFEAHWEPLYDALGYQWHLK